ncbi:unnamed protein product [Rotaria sp. Silwood2]|nr:unnamed protein product [Rotaria sp. Silwood2]
MKSKQKDFTSNLATLKHEQFNITYSEWIKKKNEQSNVPISTKTIITSSISDFDSTHHIDRVCQQFRAAKQARQMAIEEDNTVTIHLDWSENFNLKHARQEKVTMLVANVYGSYLQVKLLSAHSMFDKTRDVVVEVQYNNPSNDTISIYKWCLPSNELNDPLFKVTCNNAPVNYIGPLIKRREPTIEDMISLEAGKTKIIQARLSSAYDMTKTGIYSIQYDIPAERVVFKHARTFESTLVRVINKRQSGLQSNNIELTIEGRPNRQREQSENMKVVRRAATLSYVSCSTSQKFQITTAVSWALNFTIA